MEYGIIIIASATFYAIMNYIAHNRKKDASIKRGQSDPGGHGRWRSA
jgi:hypothetical protein